mmetsp:Transcript_11700/g.11642  ORF Transcript_11700/g.11642 Transcript_11700/m.11642 type:complete len:181 (+) Transcript_11700:413-955(+)
MQRLLPKNLRRLRTNNTEELKDMITGYHETYKTKNKEVDSQLTAFEADLIEKTKELSGSLLESTNQIFREFEEIFKNLKSELAEAPGQNAKRELEKIEQIQRSEKLKDRNLAVNKDKKTKEKKISFKTKSQTILSEILQELSAKKFDASRIPRLEAKIENYREDLKAKEKTKEKNTRIIE